MPLQCRVTVYIVCSEDDLSGGVAELSCLVALPGVRTCDIPKISKKAREVQGVGRSYQQIKEQLTRMLASLSF